MLKGVFFFGCSRKYNAVLVLKIDIAFVLGYGMNLDICPQKNRTETLDRQPDMYKISHEEVIVSI